MIQKEVYTMANVCMRCNSATTTHKLCQWPTMYRAIFFFFFLLTMYRAIAMGCSMQWVTHAYAYFFPISNIFYLCLCHYRTSMYIFPIKSENISDKIMCLVHQT